MPSVLRRVCRHIRAPRIGRLGLALLGVVLLGTASLTGPAQAQAPRPYLMTTQEAVRLKQAAEYLNSVKTMRARFAQSSSTGNYAEGTVYMRRPGRMRIEYDPPAQVLVVANGSYVVYEDGELQQVSYIGLNDTPLGLLLRENVEFTDPEITLTGMRTSADMMEIDLVQTKDPGQGTLTLIFATNPFELRQWRVRDAQGVEVSVTLLTPRFGVDLDSSLFKYTEKPGFRREN